jgi:tetratricopeptide (TPR) repeat protein
VQAATRLITLSSILFLLANSAAGREQVMGMSKRVYDVISRVQEMIEAESYDEALDDLQSMLERRRKLSSYEIAHMLNMSGYIYYQLDQLALAMASYQEALSLPDLPPSQIRALLTTTSQLALVTEDYKTAEKYALQLLKSAGDEPPRADSHIILAQAYFGQELWQSAVEPLRTAIQMQRDAGRTPRENWMAMLSAAYYNMDDFESMREVLYELVTLYPNEQYLMNLAALHGQLGETKKQLALVESLMDDQRLRRGHHLLSLVNLFMAHALPYKAATLLQTGLESGRIEKNQRNLELLSQAWYLAGQEREAIPPLEEAAAMAEDGGLYLRVARLYMDLYDWRGAQTAATAAAKKGGLREPGAAYLLQGMALARMEKLEPARKAFLLAAEHKDSKKWAQQWLDFVINEQQRVQALQM